MRTFTVTLEDGDVAVLERISVLAQINQSLEQLIQEIVNTGIRHGAILLTNPHAFTGLSVNELTQIEGERLHRKSQES